MSEAHALILTLIERGSLDEAAGYIQRAKTEGLLSDGQLAGLRTAYGNKRAQLAAAAAEAAEPKQVA